MNDLVLYYAIFLTLGFAWAMWPRNPRNRRLTRFEAWMRRRGYGR